MEDTTVVSPSLNPSNQGAGKALSTRNDFTPGGASEPVDRRGYGWTIAYIIVRDCSKGGGGFRIIVNAKYPCLG